MLELEADADKLERLELEKLKQDVLLFTYGEESEKLIRRYKQMEEQLIIMMAAMDEQSRMNALKLLLMNSILVQKKQAEDLPDKVVGVDEDVVRKLMEGYE